MIFIILGTQKFQFDRLLKKIDYLKQQNIISEEVIVQSGYSLFKCQHVTCMPFLSHEEFNKYIEKSNYIICHGGTGAIISSIKYNKKVISFPRLKEYDEHVDNHQLEIINQFVDNGYILSGEVDMLETIISDLHTFKPETYISNTDNIIDIINNFIK